jgi:hypothetical protein
MIPEGDNRTSFSSNIFLDESDLNNNNNNNNNDDNNNNNEEKDGTESVVKEGFESKKEFANRVIKYLLESSTPNRCAPESDSFCTRISSNYCNTFIIFE